MLKGVGVRVSPSPPKLISASLQVLTTVCLRTLSVTNDGKFEVLGIVVGNIEHELLPVQVATVLDEENELLEERKYMLPQGFAIHVKHLKALIISK